jgi:hypothetical protein
MATYLPVLMLCALSTSENVPSPFLDMRRYSELAVTVHEDIFIRDSSVRLTEFKDFNSFRICDLESVEVVNY